VQERTSNLRKQRRATLPPACGRYSLYSREVARKKGKAGKKRGGKKLGDTKKLVIGGA